MLEGVQRDIEPGTRRQLLDPQLLQAISGIAEPLDSASNASNASAGPMGGSRPPRLGYAQIWRAEEANGGDQVPVA